MIIFVLGGCVVEEIMFDDVIIGVYDDFKCVIKLVCSMVIEYGMFDFGFI